jgi:hypothetical protein
MSSLTPRLDKVENKANPNTLINGCFEYWQRGTSFTSIGNNTYFADRWKYSKNVLSVGVNNIERVTDIPSSGYGLYSPKVSVTTIQAPLGSASFYHISQVIEGTFLRNIKGKKLALRFWVKSSKVGTHCIALSNNGATKTLVKEYEVAQANTWELKTIRFEHDSSGTWLYDTGVGMRVIFCLAAGSSFQTTPDTWQSGVYLCTANQVNLMDNLLNEFLVTDVALVIDNESEGEIDFGLAGRDLTEELGLCQRYYEKSYDIDITPGTISALGDTRITITSTPSTCETSIPYNRKRVAPVVSTYSPNTGTIARVRNLLSSTDVVAVVDNYAEKSSRLYFASGTSPFAYHWTADAEL